MTLSERKGVIVGVSVEIEFSFSSFCEPQQFRGPDTYVRVFSDVFELQRSSLNHIGVRARRGGKFLTFFFFFFKDFAHSELEWAVYGYHAFKDARPEDFFTLLRKRFSGSALIAAILFWGNRCPRDLEGLASKILNACEPIASPAERQQLQLLLMRAKARARPRVYAVNDAMGVNVAVVLERKASWTEAINGKERLQGE